MNEVSLKPVIEELENLFSKFNARFFADKLEKPVITVSPDHTRGAYGWCTGWKAWKAGEDEGHYEINLCAEYLNRPFEETCGTLIHEMVHLQNLQDGVQDTSRSGTYHNKKFKETAEAHGLTVEKGEKYGWHKTTLSPEALEFVQSLGKQGFTLVRPRPLSLKGSSKGGGSSSRKYVCPCCGAIIRATKEVRVICADCDCEFQEGYSMNVKLTKRKAWELISRIQPRLNIKQEATPSDVAIFKASTGPEGLEIRCENDWFNHNGRIKLTIGNVDGGTPIIRYYHPDTLNRDYVAEQAEKEAEAKQARKEWVWAMGKEMAHRLVD